MFSDIVVPEAKPGGFKIFNVLQTAKHIDGAVFQGGLHEKVAIASNVHDLMWAAHIFLRQCPHYFFSLE